MFQLFLIFVFQIIKKNITQVYSEFSAKEADELDLSEVTLLRSKYEDVAPSVCPYRKLCIPAVVSVSNYPNATVGEILNGTVPTEQSREETYSKTWTEEELMEEARTLEKLYGVDNFNNIMLTVSPLTILICIFVDNIIPCFDVSTARVCAVLPAGG